MADRMVAPLTCDEETALRRVLPRAIKKFCHLTDYSGVTETHSYYDAWFQMPGLDEQYASLGFEFGLEPLYWTVPRPPNVKVPEYETAGYLKSANYYWKYVMLPTGFSSLSDPEQERAVVALLEQLLREDERLRGC
jgi:hypothetical protein